MFSIRASPYIPRRLLNRTSHARAFVSARKNAIVQPHFIIGAGFLTVAGATLLLYNHHHSKDSRHILRSDGSNSKSDILLDVQVVGRKSIQSVEEPPRDAKDSSYIPDWSAIGDKIRDAVLPSWALTLPGYVEKLQTELSSAPGSLADEIWQEAQDPAINPEILREATVRVSTELCDEEKRFLEKRKHYTRRALAKYLELDENLIDLNDVPTIAMCGSGGGLRALVAGSSSYSAAQEAGLFDCVTYTAGVSGSCWLQGLYYSTISGQRHDRLLEHLKHRIGVHIAFPPPLLKLVTSSPTNKFLLSGGLEKYRGVKNADFGIVDVYGLMLGARLLVPKGDLAVDEVNLKISNQRRYIDEGQQPLPIYTAVRHEIPLENKRDKGAEEAVAKAKKEAWFQWLEFTPYEFWCEEWESGVPTWAVGREFRNGRSTWRENGLCLPELRLPLLMGVFGSAFCATLSHYYKELRPIVQGLTGFGDVDKMINERDEDLVKLHPIDPAQVPNFALGMREHLPKTCPDSVHESPHIQLMDAGMSNNLPIYPLLRPGRNVDIIIAFDASADVKKDNWLRVADGYAKKRGIKGWPLGSGWPEQEAKGPEKTGKALEEADKASASKADAKAKAATQDQAAARRDAEINPGAAADGDLSYCTIWVGTTEERPQPASTPSPRVSSADALSAPGAGIAVIYFPFLANSAVEGVDPRTSEFLSTWNFVYTPEQVDMVVRLARSNFAEGEERTKMCVRAVYERKRAVRLEGERRRREGEWSVAGWE